ncbi:MAG: extracellular solute-binding protein [Planctomycetota bacterium]
MSASLEQNGKGQRIGLALIACLWPLLLAGCPDTGGRPDNGTPREVDLTLLVVDDPALAAAIGQLGGEWCALSGFDFHVEQMSQEEVDAQEAISADAVVCPSCQVGGFAEKAGVAPLPDNLLESDEGRWSEIFSLLRVRETVWGKEVVGVPFGSPVFVIYYRPDLLEKLDRRPPQTWTEYRELAELLLDRNNLGDKAPPDDAPWTGAIEPLGPGWAAVVLLARAAPYARHRENYSTMFSVDTMEPLIDGPPFVRALEELVAATASGPPGQLTYDPAAARAAFWEGRCGLALSWPSAAADSAPAGKNVPVGLAELPGSAEAYDVGEGAWETRPPDDDPHVPLLGTAGRLGVVLASSKSPEAAFQLLWWLSEEQSTQLAPSSPATTLFSNVHIESPNAWVEEQIPPAVAAQYAELTQQTLSRPQWLFAVRLPGRRKYLAALDEAVRRAVEGQQSPEQALRQAAASWREITEQLGPESQRKAYWNSLGLE